MPDRPPGRKRNGPDTTPGRSHNDSDLAAEVASTVATGHDAAGLRVGESFPATVADVAAELQVLDAVLDASGLDAGWQ